MIGQSATHQWLSLAPHLTSPVSGVLAGGVVALVVLADVLLFLGTLVSVLKSPQSGGMKLVWCLVVFAAPFVGCLLWFFIGRPNAARTSRREY